MEIEECKQISILDVANRLGISFKQVSNSVYEHPEHDSFRIFSTTNTFKWFSRDIQGDVIDFVRLVKGISFKEALGFLSQESFQKEAVQEKRERPFYYPLKRIEDSNCSLARYYLTECRGISEEIIQKMIQQGLITQASWKTNETVEPVIVFKSFDHRHKLQAASLQGIYKNHSLPRERLKTILKGSHGHVGISFDIGHPNRLVFCESFIDLMSYYELHQQSLSDVRLVSMEGLKRSVVAYQTLRLIAEENQKLEFLDTVIPSKLLPLINTIRDTTSYFDNHPDLLTLAVDCDDAGKDFSDKLSQSGFPVLLVDSSMSLLQSRSSIVNLISFLEEYRSSLLFLSQIHYQVNPVKQAILIEITYRKNLFLHHHNLPQVSINQDDYRNRWWYHELY